MTYLTTTVQPSDTQLSTFFIIENVRTDEQKIKLRIFY